MVLKKRFFLLFSIFFFNYAYSQSTFKNDSVICWQEGLQLSWKDFQGKPDTVITYLGTTATAVIAAPIRYRIIQLGNTISVHVKVEFLKNHSWVTDTTNDIGLKHEQLHFDIAELYGRKIRKEVEAFNDQGIYDIDVVTKRVKQLVIEKNERNTLYDRKTGHGIVDFRQLEWQEVIEKELEELKEYASSQKDCEL